MLGRDWWNNDRPTAVMRDFRVIYVNDEIGVVHSFNEYPDGSKEALMAVYSIRGGQVTRSETGATPFK